VVLRPYLLRRDGREDIMHSGIRNGCLNNFDYSLSIILNLINLFDNKLINASTNFDKAEIFFQLYNIVLFYLEDKVNFEFVEEFVDILLSKFGDFYDFSCVMTVDKELLKKILFALAMTSRKRKNFKQQILSSLVICWESYIEKNHKSNLIYEIIIFLDFTYMLNREAYYFYQFHTNIETDINYNNKFIEHLINEFYYILFENLKIFSFDEDFSRKIISSIKKGVYSLYPDDCNSHKKFYIESFFRILDVANSLFGSKSEVSANIMIEIASIYESDIVFDDIIDSKNYHPTAKAEALTNRAISIFKSLPEKRETNEKIRMLENREHYPPYIIRNIFFDEE
jgi:hypothetical protein